MNGDDDKDLELAKLLEKLPQEIEPSRELWTGVAARIAAKQRRVVVMRRVAVGTSALVAAAAVVLVLRAPRGPVAVHTKTDDGITGLAVAPLGTARPVEPRDVPPVVLAPLVPEEASYGAAMATLTTAMDGRLAVLPAKDADSIRKSLEVIHQAIEATRASLERDPANADLRAQLDDEYDQAIETMNDVLDWTTRS